jgi:hypothetical protein
MDEQQKQFLEEVESEIIKRRNLQNMYTVIRITLMLLIAICGFLTATNASESGIEWISKPYMLFIFGFVSFVCASLNQYLTPSAMKVFHQNIRKALEFIKNEVQYSNMDLADASKFKSIAIIEPEIVLGKLKNMFTDDK